MHTSAGRRLDPDDGITPIVCNRGIKWRPLVCFVVRSVCSHNLAMVFVASIGSAVNRCTFGPVSTVRCEESDKNLVSIKIVTDPGLPYS